MSVGLRVKEGLLVALIAVCSVHLAGCAGIPGAAPEKSSSPGISHSVPDILAEIYDANRDRWIN